MESALETEKAALKEKDEEAKDADVEEQARKNMSFNEDTPCIGLARVGTASQKIVSGTLKSFMEKDLGEPMHSFIICGQMHEIEEEMY